MRLPVLVICFALAIPVLLSCDQQRSAADIDPELGLDCLGKHRASLPPGTQYEGIEGIVENRLTIKVMTGAEVTTINCLLNPDGTIQGAEK